MGIAPVVRVAVTGSSGQIGSHLLRHLARSHEVHGFDLRPSPQTTVVDLASSEAVGQLRGFDVIYHLAAAISVAESVELPQKYVRTNVEGTVNVLEAARRNDGRLVLVSTAAVYGNPLTTPIPETHPLNPLSPYGLTKRTTEEFGTLYRQLYGLDLSIVRPFNVYSEDLKPNDPYAGVIAIFLRNAETQRPLEVHGDGGQTRDFVHVSDVVALLELLGSRPGTGEAYNCGTGSPISVSGLAELVRDRFGPTTSIVRGASRPGDIRHSVADITKARGIGYVPKVTLADWIRATPGATRS